VTTFSGFSPQAIEFYAALSEDPTKEFWQAHKQVYDAEVREPMLALLDELEPEFGPGRLFRPYRDTRFSHDKAPYKLQQGAIVGSGTGVGCYLHVDAEGLLVGGGFRAHSPEQTDRLRKAVADDDSGRQFESIIRGLRAAGFSIEGAKVKTTPRGYRADHPRIELLRHKEVMAIQHLGTPRWLSTRKAVERVREEWREIGPLRDWVDTHVGAP
jgi:uncharacterized protein (TIGR02453 family)